MNIVMWIAKNLVIIGIFQNDENMEFDEIM